MKITTRRAGTLLAAAALTASSLTATATSAHANDDFSISGHIYSSYSGLPVANVTVHMWESFGGPYRDYGHNATTDANGYYHVLTASGSSYHIELVDNCGDFPAFFLGEENPNDAQQPGGDDPDSSLATTIEFIGQYQVDYALKALRQAPAVGPCNRVAPTYKTRSNPRVGEPIVPDPGVWTPAGTTFTYQWYDFSPITSTSVPIPANQHGTDPTYTPRADQVGHSFQFVLAAHYASVTNTLNKSTGDGPTQPSSFASVSTPVMAGLPLVGSTLQVAVGATKPTSVASYQWTRNGAPIPGATGSSYKITSADRGRLVAVVVKYSAQGYNTVTRTATSAFAVRKAAKESVKAKGGHRSAKFTVKVSPHASKHHKGTITVRDETGKKVKGATIKSGSVTFTAKHLTKGTHHYTVLYLGSSYAYQKTVKVKVK